MIRWALTAAVVAASIAAGGCQPPRLCADDTVIMGDRKSPVRVHAIRRGLLTLGRRIPDVDITVHVAGKEVARGRTNQHGFIDVEPRLPAGTKQFEARAVILGRKHTATGRVFTWPERTIVVVDVDQTISDTDYRALIWGTGQDISSKPLPHAAETLTQIATHFNVFYLTARPHELLDKTREWIEEHGFPAGPIITSDSLYQLTHQRKYKVKAIRDIQKLVPYVLIGIGDRATNAEAYGQTGLLTVVLTEGEPKRFCGHAVLVPDWRSVGEFFKANRKDLQDPRRLERILKTRGMLLRPTIPWAPAK